MELKIYTHSNDLLEDNKKFIERYALEADLVYINAYANIGEEGFYEAVVRDADRVLIAIQSKPYPRVHFCNCIDVEDMAQVLVESYIGEGSIPDEISGNEIAVKSVVKAFEEKEIKYNLSKHLIQRKCESLRDIAVNDVKVINTRGQGYDFGSFYIEFLKECGLERDTENASKITKKMSNEGRLYAVVKDGEIITIVMKGRVLAQGRAISFVYTPPQHRGKGYSLACVKYVTQSLFEEGNAFAYLYADSNNPISNHIYQKLGYERIGDLYEYKRI